MNVMICNKAPHSRSLLRTQTSSLTDKHTQIRTSSCYFILFHPFILSQATLPANKLETKIFQLEYWNLRQDKRAFENVNDWLTDSPSFGKSESHPIRIFCLNILSIVSLSSRWTVAPSFLLSPLKRGCLSARSWTSPWRQKVTKGWRLESVFPWKKGWLPTRILRQVCGPKVSKLSLFIKRQTSQMPGSSFTSEGGKVSMFFFFWRSVKTQRCSSLLLDVETVKNLMTFPKHSSLLRCKSWKLRHIEIRVSVAAMWFSVETDICSRGVDTK